MVRKKQLSLKSIQTDFKRDKSILNMCQLLLSILYFFKIILVSFVGGRVLAYKGIYLFEIKILLIVLILLIVSRFLSSKIETKKVKLKELDQMIYLKKLKYKKKGNYL